LWLLWLFHCSPLLEPSLFPIFSLKFLQGGLALSQRDWCEFLLLSLWLWQGLCPVPLPLHRSEDSAGLSLSFPEGMVLCKPGRELRMSPRNFRWSMDVMLCPWCCMGRKARPWGRAGRVSDADDICFCLTVIDPASSICVPVSAAWVLEFQNQYHCSRLCLWCFLCHAWRRCGLLASRCCAALVCCILCVYWDSIRRAC